MSGQALDRRGHELFERRGAGFGLRGLAGSATQVAAYAARFTQFGRTQTRRRCLLRVDSISVAPGLAE